MEYKFELFKLQFILPPHDAESDKPLSFSKFDLIAVMPVV